MINPSTKIENNASPILPLQKLDQATMETKKYKELSQLFKTLCETRDDDFEKIDALQDQFDQILKNLQTDEKSLLIDEKTIEKHLEQLFGKNIQKVDLSRLSKEELEEIKQVLNDNKDKIKESLQDIQTEVAFKNQLFLIIIQIRFEINKHITRSKERMVQNQISR